MSENQETTSRQIFGLILDLAREIRCCSRDEAFCGDLTFQQFVVLDAVAQAGDLDLAALHGILAVEKSTTTRLIDPLLRRGLLKRDKAAHDSRAARLSLTEEGRRTHREVWQCQKIFFSGVARQIGDGDRKAVFRALRRFAEALGKAAAECRCGVPPAGADGTTGLEGQPTDGAPIQKVRSSRRA